MIRIKQLNYHYKIFEKSSGLLGSFSDFFTRKYELFPALKNLNVHIQEGESVGLLGSNGAGKTTLIKLMTGIISPTEGQVSCLGFNPYHKEKSFLKDIGVVLGQKSQLIWDLPAKETLDMLKIIYDIKQDVFEKRLAELCELLEVSHKLNIPVRKLSLGERMKFEIICALIHSPKILFLDEPTIGLDLLSQRAIRLFLRHINQMDKITIILTSHYMTDIQEVSNRVIVLSKGNTVDDLPIEELMTKYASDTMVRITFKKFVPSNLSAYIEQEKTICVSEDVYNSLAKTIDLTQVASITSIDSTFEDIMLKIFDENR